MVTLIRTLKRINKSTPARAPPIQSQSRPNESSTTNNIITAQTPQHVTAAAGYDHHDAQLKRTANSAIDVIKLNEKGTARAPSNTSNNSQPPQKASFIAIADTSDVRYEAVAANPEKKNFQTQSYRKRKSTSASDDNIVNGEGGGGVCIRSGAKKRIRKRCSSNGCTNRAQNGGLCFGHGAKAKRCSREGCKNKVINGGVCIRHGAKVKQCSSDGCTNYAITGGVCWRHGAKDKVKRCSSDGCKNYIVKGGLCTRHGAKELCSSVGCKSRAHQGRFCKRHGSVSNIQEEFTA